MFVLYAASTDELELSGTTLEFANLADLLEAGEGEVGLEVVDPSPYEAALAWIVVRVDDGPLARVGLVGGSGALEFTGGQWALSLLGENLRSFGATSDGGNDHLHIEHYDGHFYLAEGSAPLVVTMAD
jgi:hypothetical protein